MPMIPELPIAMLACARIGAPHTVVFGGFSAEALSDRINDAEAKLVITADGGWRRGKPAALKPAVDEALELTSTIEQTLVVRRVGDALEGAPPCSDGRDVWWHDIVERQSRAARAGPGRQRAHALPAVHVRDHGQAQGHHAHDRRLPARHRYTHEMMFDVKPDDVYWCAADIGWVTGHSYIVYGPLANATTSVMYEGTPDTPAWDRWWQIIEDYKVTHPVLRADGDPRPHEAGIEPRAGRTTCRPCACSARSASPSTPRRGCGTTSTSVGGRRRSSIPGGRPRRA